jgi:hypothetical protein
MVRRRERAVSGRCFASLENHEARLSATSFETRAMRAPQDEGIRPLATQIP